jgi:hypothetical protein
LVATIAIDVASLMFGLPLRQFASAVSLLSGVLNLARYPQPAIEGWQ